MYGNRFAWRCTLNGETKLFANLTSQTNPKCDAHKYNVVVHHFSFHKYHSTMLRRWQTCALKFHLVIVAALHWLLVIVVEQATCKTI